MKRATDSSYRFFILFMLLAVSMLAWAQEIPAPPDPPRLVVDHSNILTAHEQALLESKLVAFDDTTSTQITVVLVSSLNGLTKEEFADRIGEEWGVGRKGKDNGVVVLVKPKTAREKGEARISVAYGLEDVIPDAVANRIVDNIMIPYFRNDDYFGGIQEATDVIMGLAAGKFTADEIAELNPGASGLLGLLPVLLFFFVFYLLIRRNSRRYYSTGGRGTSFLTGLLLGSMLSHRGSSGSWSHFNSGSGSFGGGGGFGGFGGGSFGGGGAGGSW